MNKVYIWALPLYYHLEKQISKKKRPDKLRSPLPPQNQGCEIGLSGLSSAPSFNLGGWGRNCDLFHSVQKWLTCKGLDFTPECRCMSSYKTPNKKLVNRYCVQDCRVRWQKGPLYSRTRTRTSAGFDYPSSAKILRTFITWTINLTLC